jgi:hypothetical protein
MNTFKILEKDVEQIYAPQPVMENGTHPIIKDNHLFLSAFTASAISLPSPFLQINLEESSVNSWYDYPRYYETEPWVPQANKVKHAYHSSTSKLYVSFPLSHDIRVIDYDMASNVLPKSDDIIFAGSRYIDSIKPHFTSMKEKIDLKTREVTNRFLLNPLYGDFIVDPYNPYYYRVAMLPAFEKDISSGKFVTRFSKQPSIIIFDKTMKIIGETLLERYKYLPIFIPSPEGLMVVRVDTEDEDLLIFDLFKIESK